MEKGGKGLSRAMPGFSGVEYFPGEATRQLPAMFTELSLKALQEKVIFQVA